MQLPIAAPQPKVSVAMLRGTFAKVSQMNIVQSVHGARGMGIYPPVKKRAQMMTYSAYVHV